MSKEHPIRTWESKLRQPMVVASQELRERVHETVRLQSEKATRRDRKHWKSRFGSVSAAIAAMLILGVGAVSMPTFHPSSSTGHMTSATGATLHDTNSSNTPHLDPTYLMRYGWTVSVFPGQMKIRYKSSTPITSVTIKILPNGVGMNVPSTQYPTKEVELGLPFQLAPQTKHIDVRMTWKSKGKPHKWDAIFSVEP